MNKIEGKFYPLQHEEWVNTVKNLTGVEIKVLYYLRSLDPFGDLDLEYGVSDIANDLNVSKGAVSKALKKLDQLGHINSELIKVRIKVKLGNSVSCRKRDDTVGNGKVPQETVKHSRKQINTVGNGHKPEPLPDNDSDSPKTNKTYSDFIDSLSDKEREEFLKFGEQKAAQLPNPPTLPRKWIETNWQELSAQWYKSKGQSSPVQNSRWETDPRTGDWLAIIEETGNPAAFALIDKERRDFVGWCYENQKFSWLRGES